MAQMARVRIDGTSYSVPVEFAQNLRKALSELQPGEVTSFEWAIHGGGVHWVRIPYEAVVVITTDPSS